MTNLQKACLFLAGIVLVYGICELRSYITGPCANSQEQQTKYDVVRLMNERYFGLFRVVHNAKPESAEKIWNGYFESVKRWNIERHVLYYRLKSEEEELADGFNNIHKLFGEIHNPALILNMCMRENCNSIEDEDKVKYREDLISNELHILREGIDNFSERLFN